MKKEKSRFELFEKAHNSKNQNSYFDKIFELRTFVDDEMINQCFDLILSDEKKSQIIGIDILSQLGSKRQKFKGKLLELIFDILVKTDNEKLIYSCLIAIYHNHKGLPNRQIKILSNFKRSKSKDIRYGVVFSLSTIENKIAIDTLIFLTKDRSPQVRDWATFGIGTHIKTDNPEIREALYKRCFDKDYQTKQEAIKGLDNRNDERVYQIISQDLKSKKTNSLIFDTIMNIKNGELYLPELKSIYQKSIAEDFENKEWMEDLKNCIEVLESDDSEEN